MNKLKYFLGPVFLALLLTALLQWQFVGRLAAITFTVFSDGQVLTAAQLNTAFSTVYNALNGHNHDGGDGEASSLAFTAATASFTAAGDITFNGANSSLEADGTTMVDVLIDQGNLDTLFGDGTKTTEQKILVRSNTGDAALALRVNNSASNTWKMYVDNSDSDKLEFSYNGTNAMELSAGGRLAAGGLAAATHGIAWELYSGTSCSSAPCDTDVDTSAPDSSAPYGFQCFVRNAANTAWNPADECSASLGACGSGNNYVQYDVSANDLHLHIGDSSHEGQPYRCIAFYQP